MRFVLAVCIPLLFAFGLAGQSTGELRLSVKDPTGAAVPAAVELINQATSTRQSVDLATDGRYSFRNLPGGFYRVTVAHDGFAPSVERVEIRPGVPQTHDVTLQVQAISASVEVVAADTLVDPARTATADYVGAEEIAERHTGLPGRGLVDLVLMQPGWVAEANGVLHPRESEYETQYVIDGFPVQDNRSPAFAGNVDADDVQSMKVYTSGIPAEYGQKVGGVIEITTDRNSSPGFHGTAVLQGGSFNTMGSYLNGQYTAGRTTASLRAEGFITDRYLDPPVIANFSNHASSNSLNGTLEHDFSDSDRIRLAFSHHATHFLVPNELFGQQAGQRVDRQSAETSGQVSYQHIFAAKSSQPVLASLRGMMRDVSARLWSNPLASPIGPAQNRGLREGYLSGSMAGHNGRHEWKVGADMRYGSIHEEFGFHLALYAVNGVVIFDPDTPADFSFTGHGLDREQSAYAEDVFHAGNFTASIGLRFDHYSLLVHEHAFSPRLGASWSLPKPGLVLHVSYDHTFGTPPFENVLVSASRQAQDLNNAGFYLPLRPSRGNYYEAGFTQTIAKRFRLESSYFLRDIHNVQDDDLLVNTGVSFPITFTRARIRGIESKLDMPRWGKFSGYLGYTNSRGIAELPIAGGLFLSDTAAADLTANDRFPVTQDQRNTARGLVRMQLTPRLWTSWTASYNSGLPVQVDPSNTIPFLISQYGAAIVSMVNFDRGRVHPSFTLSASVGADLWRHEKRSATAQLDVMNITDRLNVIDFAGYLSNTAVAPPRSLGGRVRFDF